MRGAVPSYALYGEETSATPEFWGHSETIESRSRLHGWEIRPHRHEALFQILHLRSGAAELLVDGRFKPVPTPCAIVVPERLEHGFRFGRDIDGAVMTFVSRRIAPLVAAHGAAGAWLQSIRTVSLGAAPGAASLAGLLADLLDRMEEELMRGERAEMAFVAPLCAGALAIARRVHAGTTLPAGAGSDRLAVLSDLMDAHFREHRPVEFYAERLGVSVTHLNRIARTGRGRPVSRLLAERLVAEARRELVFTDHPVQAIAERLGFEDPAYFTRFFALNAGLSPRRFRDSERARLRA